MIVYSAHQYKLTIDPVFRTKLSSFLDTLIEKINFYIKIIITAMIMIIIMTIIIMIILVFLGDLATM